MTPAFQSHWGIVMGIIELICLATAVFLLLPHRHSHHRWLHSRIGAELCRTYLAAWQLDRREDPFPFCDMPGFEGLWRSLRVAWYLDRGRALAFEAARDDYRQNRVLHQLNYFREYAGIAAGRMDLLRRVAWAATIGAILTTVWVVVLHLMHQTGQIYWAIKVCSLVLPLLNAAALSLIVSHDLARRATRYREMTSGLTELDKRLAACRTWPSLFRIVRESEELLLQEVSEWRSITLVTGESH